MYYRSPQDAQPKAKTQTPKFSGTALYSAPLCKTFFGIKTQTSALYLKYLDMGSRLAQCVS